MRSETKSVPAIAVGLLIGLSALSTSPAPAANVVSTAIGSTDQVVESLPVNTRSFRPLTGLVRVPEGTDPHFTGSVLVRNGFDPVRNVRVNVAVFGLDGSGANQETLVFKTLKTNRAGLVSVDLSVPDGVLQVKWGLDLMGKKATYVGAYFKARTGGACADTANAACLLDRFLVQARLGERGNVVDGRVVGSQNGSAEFELDQGSLTVSIKDECSRRGSYSLAWAAGPILRDKGPIVFSVVDYGRATTHSFSGEVHTNGDGECPHPTSFTLPSCP